jgi:choline dehydrogenase-like flavoprotein
MVENGAAASAAAILLGGRSGFMQVRRTPKTYDVCVIGSGASGGTAAKVLTEGGLSVALLEAGPPLVPARDYKEHVWPYDLPPRRIAAAEAAAPFSTIYQRKFDRYW